MTPTQKAAMEQALEALKGYEHVHGAYSNAEAAITMLQAALAETAEPVAGWKLVPANLTQDMADSAKVVDGRLSVWKYADVYRAMLAAAPQPPVQWCNFCVKEVGTVCQDRNQRRECEIELPKVAPQPPAPAVDLTAMQQAGKAAAHYHAWSKRYTAPHPQPPAPAEPVGEMVGHHKVGFGEMPTIRWRDGYWPQVGTKLYIAQPPAPAVELTDAELDIICGQTIAKNGRFNLGYLNDFARAAIAAHEQKRSKT